MRHQELIENYVGQKAHFDIHEGGHYLIDFSGLSYPNVVVSEAHEQFLIIFDEIEKSYLAIPYSSTVIRFKEKL